MSLPVISDDPEQDVAFVLHTLEKIIFEWIKDNVEKNSGSEITDYDVHIFTDGCKAQFKNSTYFWYISQIGPSKGIRLPMSVTIVSASNASLKYFIKDEELQILKHVAGVFEDANVIKLTPVQT